MRKTGFYVGLILILVLSVGILSGCGGKKEALRIGTEASFKPFEFTNESNEVVGFDIDIAKEIAAKIGREVKIVNMDFSGLIGALQANQIDLAVAGMSITPERQQSIDFSDPYYDASQVIVVQEATTSISTKDDLVGKTIAVQMGTTGADAAAKVEGAKLKQFQKVNEAFLELQNGRADAVVIDAPVAKEYLKNMTGLKIASDPFTEEKYGIGIKKDNTKLLEDVNKALQEIVKSGKYQELYDKWFKS